MSWHKSELNFSRSEISKIARDAFAMKNTADQLRTRSATLPRVEDLEHSIQWISLANDIDDLERLRHRSKSLTRRDKRGAIEKHTYQRASMPDMQQACTTRCNDDRDAPSQKVDRLADYLEPRDTRWSWKPRTDFEREYFYKDYKDCCYGDLEKCCEPGFHEPSRDRSGSLQEARRSSESPGARSSTRYDVAGLEREHYSDSRERLHEIFEHNRYLRRLFFADTPGNARQDSHGFARSYGKNNQETSRRYIGFGSTETLTSQSNQSSVSSVNDRKSRGRTTRSPEEEEEEEDVLTELVRKSNVPSSRAERKNVKVLVNILPGSDLRRVESAAPPNVAGPGKEGSRVIEEDRFRNATKKMHDKSSQCGVTENEIDRGAWRRERKLPEYIFGATARTDLPAREDRGLAGEHEKLERKRLPKDETRSPRLDSALTDAIGDRNYRNPRGSLPNLTIARRNLAEPLYVARAVNVPESLGSPDDRRLLDRHVVRSHREQRCERTSTRSIGRGQSAKTTDERAPFSSERLTSRSRVKAARIIPSPLDLSAVNEQCERIEATERRHLNDYSVDVAILRSHEDLVEDMFAAGNERAIENVIGNVRDAESRRERDDRRRTQSSYEPPRKSCDLSLAEELQSPQLVNNCKNDPRSLDPASIETPPPPRRGIDAGRRDRATSPLFDPIGGPHAAGSALPSTVYGPIPYSQ